ncbi:LamG domain-containing protein [Litorilituus sediminis]|uniref:LamG domain-containing protein n=1 Tax=Litorilituus sediminis TaxID=718192 RepID=A0A4P6P8J3_9GAMM|nr:LamG domain-containing protein [Litorilituus sediminis]QBG36609.1 LamG domain-containing protein [Litorilituus sediminis]
MLTRFVGIFLVVFASILTNLAYGAACLDIFPGATNDNLANKGLEFINVPPFTGADWYLTNPDHIPLGDSQHLSWYSQQIITVSSTPVSETTARLYIANGASWTNAKINVGGNPEDLIIIVNGSMAISGGISGGNTEINAIIYATGSITITGKVEINGAVAAEGALSTTPSADIDYDDDAIAAADFNGMCDNGAATVTPILDFHFDECSYTGAANEVIDSVGNYAGTAMNGLNTADAGQIEKFAQITDDQHYVDTSVPLPSSYSVSTWFKKPTATTGNDYFVLGAMASGGDLLYLDRSNSWRWGVYDGSNASNGSYSFASLDDNWHHLTLVYNAGQTLLYIDGVQVDSVNRVPAGTLKYIATSFDQVNSSSPQGFRAPLDEFMVFDGVLSAGAIQTLYNNQLAQNNYDGTARAPVVCQSLLALYKFEQTDFSTQIDDTSGLDNHAANLFGGLSTPDGKYCRGFESESWNDSNAITDSFRSPLDVNDNIGLQGTISFWFQSRIDWDQGQERVLFDASAGSNQTDKYFVFEIQQDGRLKFAFEDSVDSDFNIIEPLNYNRSADIWYYLTVTWDYVNNSFAIYVDGNLVSQQTRNTNGAMGELLPIVFGDNSSDYTQAGNSNIASPYSSFGNYDEVRIYNRVLSQAEIQADRDDDTGCEKNLIAEWRMDEINWSGASGEVLDQIANFHGQAFNGANTQSSEPARVGNPGTCGYGVFDGIDDYVAIADDPAFDLEEQLTVSAWVYPESLPSSDLMTILSKDENYEFHLTPQGEINWWWQTNSYTSSGANITPGNWYHIAITYQDGQQVIYVNGVDRGARTYSGSLVLNNDPIQIGQDQFHPGRYFHGRIDEVRIYDYALNSGETNAVYQDTHPCTIYIDHFEIDTLDEQGLTCEADNIVIRACADASCSTLNTDEFTVELLVNNTSKGNITFSGGSVTTDYVHTTAGNAALSLSQAYSCRNSTTSPCNVDFRDAGFVINNALGDGIPHQISGKPSDTGYNARDLYLKAVKTDDSTGACVGLFPDGADVPVNLSYTCHGDSSACSSNLTLTNNGADKLLTQTAASHSLRFSADSTAYFSLTYPDAGKLILNAQKLVEVEDSQGNKETLNLQTSSNAFVEKPFAFKLDFSADSNAGDAYALDPDGSKFKVAGDTFKMTATAVQWANGQDTDNNGIPDDLTAVTGNATANHFDAKSLTTTHTLQLPLGGQQGILTAEQSNTFANSVVTNDFNYSEVGIIQLNTEIEGVGSNSGDYLGAGNVFGEVQNVGRFIPAYFDLAQNDGALAVYCDINPPTLPFAYVGQKQQSDNSIGAIRYGNGINDNPSFTITAMSKNGANVTQNYTGAFMKLVETSIERVTPTLDSDIVNNLGSLGNQLAIEANINKISTKYLQENEAEGVITVTYKDEDNYFYEHVLNAQRNLITSDIDLLVNAITDEDGVVPENPAVPVLTLEPTGVEVRFGRANLANSYGPETSPLPQELSVEYFKDGNYLLADTDSCSQYNSANVSYGLPNEPGISASDIEAVTGNFVEVLDPPNGLTRAIVIKAPGAGNTGQVRVNYNIYDWLKFDWSGNGSFTENPWAIATFGTYRGNDRIIYQREVSR